MSRVCVLQGGRSLERQVSLRSGARVEDALERLGHEVHGIDVGHDLVSRLRTLAPDVAFVPGRGAYMDGRGAESMRLNYSGVADDDIREGVRRIGEVVAEQLELFGSITGTRGAAPAPGRRPERPKADAELADVLELRRRRAAG